MFQQRAARAQGAYDVGYGTVLDSGTTFTYLPTRAFASFLGAVKGYALAHGLRQIKGPDSAVRCSPCCCALYRDP